MGGNALKKTATRRYDIDEYNYIYNEKIKNIISRVFPDTLFGVPSSILSKRTFGDLDIVISNTNLPDDWKAKVFESFGSVDFSENFSLKNNPNIHPRDERNFFSLNFNDLQVDFILTNDSSFNYTLKQLSFGDASGFIGRVFSEILLHEDRFGLKKRLVFNGAETKTLFYFSSDFNLNRGFLGYEPSQWDNGFDNEEDLFRYITSSIFFKKSLFNPNNFNSSQRLNYKKRESTRAFVDFCMSNYSNLNDGSNYSTGYISDRINKFFPNLQEIEGDVSGDYEKIIMKKKLFSHDHFKKISRDSNFRTEDFMLFIKNRDFNLNNDDFNLFISKNSYESITAYVESKIKQFILTVGGTDRSPSP